MSALNTLQQYLPARFSTTALPWIPSGTPGKSAKPMRFLPGGSGFVELLRMEPGVVMPLHRHTGEIHAYNLSGSRQLSRPTIMLPKAVYARHVKLVCNTAVDKPTFREVEVFGR